MSDREEPLEILQDALTELAQAVGFDPDGLDDISVVRAVGESFARLTSERDAYRAACRKALGVLCDDWSGTVLWAYDGTTLAEYLAGVIGLDELPEPGTPNPFTPTEPAP
jgi:hypothetical protein